jgi:hypothetical protein
VLVMDLLPGYLRAQGAAPAGAAGDTERREAADLAQLEKKVALR